MSYNSTHIVLTERAANRALSDWYGPRATGRRIQWAREQAGISRQELADYADMSPRTLHRIERGERSLTSREQAAIARGLGVSFVFLALDNRQQRKEGRMKIKYVADSGAIPGLEPYVRADAQAA